MGKNNTVLVPDSIAGVSSPPEAGLSKELDEEQLAEVTGGMNKSDLIAAIATNVNDAKPSQR